MYYESVEWWNRRKDGIGEVSERILEERIGVLEECAYYARTRSTNIVHIINIYIYIYINNINITLASICGSYIILLLARVYYELVC